MCDIIEKKYIDKVSNSNHLDLILYHQRYAIFRDCDLWYFALIDKHFKPLRLYDGSFDQVQEIFKAYAETGKVFWNILKDG